MGLHALLVMRMLLLSEYGKRSVASSTAYNVRHVLHDSVQMSNKVCTTQSESDWFDEYSSG